MSRFVVYIPSLTALDWFERAFAVFAIIVTSTAFIPLIESGGAFVENAFTPLLFICFALIYTAVAVLLFARLNELMQLVRQNVPLFSFFAFLLVASLWAQDTPQTFLAAVAAILTALVACYLIIRFRPEEWLLLFGIAFAIIITGSVLMTRWFPYMGMHATGTWRGVFINRNGLATYTAVAIGTFYLLAVSRYYSRPVWVLLFLASCFVMFKTQSKTSLMALYVGVFQSVLLAALYRLRFSYGTLSVVLFAVMGPLIYWLISSNWQEVALMLGRDATLSGRVEAWDEVWTMIQQRPWLGFGELTLENVAPPHNMFLALWLEVGLWGVIGFSLVYLLAVLQAVNMSRAFPYHLRYAFTFILTFILVRGAMEGLYFTTLLWILLIMGVTGPRYYLGRMIHKPVMEHQRAEPVGVAA